MEICQVKIVNLKTSIKSWSWMWMSTKNKKKTVHKIEGKNSIFKKH